MEKMSHPYMLIPPSWQMIAVCMLPPIRYYLYFRSYIYTLWDSSEDQQLIYTFCSKHGRQNSTSSLWSFQFVHWRFLCRYWHIHFTVVYTGRIILVLRRDVDICRLLLWIRMRHGAIDISCLGKEDVSAHFTFPFSCEFLCCTAFQFLKHCCW